MKADGGKRQAPTLDLTTMVMVRDAVHDRALVIDRVKSWTGLSFPGGHLEPGESLAACAAREVLEETGLRVTDLVPCGIIHWLHEERGDRYLAFLFRTTAYEGSLHQGTDEGKIFWMGMEALLAHPSTNGFDKYLPLFLGESSRELFIPWNDSNPWGNTG